MNNKCQKYRFPRGIIDEAAKKLDLKPETIRQRLTVGSVRNKKEVLDVIEKIINEKKSMHQELNIRETKLRKQAVI